MDSVERKTSILERGVQFALALVVSVSMFSLALVMPFFWQGCICLFAAIVACEMLYVFAFWPKVEQVVGQNRSKLSLNVGNIQRNAALKCAFATSGCQTVIMLIVWMLFRAHIIGGMLLLVFAITDFILWRKFQFLNCDAGQACVQENRVKHPLLKSENAKGQSMHGNSKGIFAVIKRHRLLIAIILITMTVIRVIAMCIMYGCPSFCTRCILYWGGHHSSYNGHHAEHSLLSVRIFEK